MGYRVALKGIEGISRIAYGLRQKEKEELSLRPKNAHDAWAELNVTSC